MFFKFCISFLFLVSSAKVLKKRQTCSNAFNGRQVRASGDWSITPWNAAEPNGLMKFNLNACVYTLSIGGLKPFTRYTWKVIYYTLIYLN